MFEVKIDTKEFKRLQTQFPKWTQRAAELALDATADAVKAELVKQMSVVFDRPTRWTLNSLQVTKTQKHVLVAKVWFKRPSRMSKHYITAEVEGGPRRKKGFELALGNYYTPPSKTPVSGGGSRGARLDAYGNISAGQIRQMLSVLGKAQGAAGYDANLTARSAKRNKKPRDYVVIGRQRGALIPGVYQRFQTGVGFGAKTKKTMPFGEWQKGATRGRFSSVIRARGLAPVLFRIARPSYSKRFPFYAISKRIADRRLWADFMRRFEQLKAGGSK